MKTAFGTFESYAQEISRLKAENEELHWRIDGLLGTGKICPLPKLNGKKFRMVNLIASRSPNLVTYEAMRFSMYSDPLENEVQSNTIKVFMHKTREVLTPEGIEIETIWGRGYRMTLENAAKWQSLVESANQQEAAA
jgi:hypothetical protein